jgi:hypothetical protein
MDYLGETRVVRAQLELESPGVRALPPSAHDLFEDSAQVF